MCLRVIQSRGVMRFEKSKTDVFVIMTCVMRVWNEKDKKEDLN